MHELTIYVNVKVFSFTYLLITVERVGQGVAAEVGGWLWSTPSSRSGLQVRSTALRLVVSSAPNHCVILTVAP